MAQIQPQIAMDSAGKPIVFLVDDDEAVRDSTQALLESYDMEVRSFPSAGAFLAAFVPGSAGCLVLDIHMPDMSGLELLDVLKARDIALPVVAITGRGDSQLAERVQRDGAAALLHKPIDDGKLVALIHKALGSGSDDQISPSS